MITKQDLTRFSSPSKTHAMPIRKAPKKVTSRSKKPKK